MRKHIILFLHLIFVAIITVTILSSNLPLPSSTLKVEAILKQQEEAERQATLHTVAAVQARIQADIKAYEEEVAAEELRKATEAAEKKKLEEVKKKEAEAKLNRIRIPVAYDFISGEHGEVADVRFGTPHDGLDFAVGSGTPIYPIAKGTVVHTGWAGVWNGCGWWTAVRHEQLKVDTIYCHQNSEPPVKAGQNVTPDTIIGYVGSTGLSTGPHLHFGVYPFELGGWNGGRTIDPRKYLKELGVEVGY